MKSTTRCPIARGERPLLESLLIHGCHLDYSQPGEWPLFNRKMKIFADIVVQSRQDFDQKIMDMRHRQEEGRHIPGSRGQERERPQQQQQQRSKMDDDLNHSVIYGEPQEGVWDPEAQEKKVEFEREHPGQPSESKSCQQKIAIETPTHQMLSSCSHPTLDGISLGQASKGRITSAPHPGPRHKLTTPFVPRQAGSRIFFDRRSTSLDQLVL